jgi:hypothetical protein
MIKLSTLFWLVLVSTTGFAMFAVKYEVQSLEEDLNRTKKATFAEEHAIRTDEAEWAYLTRPETLEQMNRRYLSLAPIATKQLRATLTDIPLRAPTPVPADIVTAETTVESAPPATPMEQAPTAPAEPITPSSAEKPTEPAEHAKPAPARTMAKPALTRRPRSLDELIAQVAASR